MSGPKNVTESLFPLLLWYAIIGNGVFRFPVHRPHPVISGIYGVIAMSVYLYTLSLTVNKIVNAPWYGYGENIVLVIVYVNAAISVIDAVLSLSNAKRYAKIIEDVTKVDETLQELGATFNYSRARYEGYALICCWVLMVISFNWVDTIWFNNVLSALEAYSVTSTLHQPVHTNIAIAFQFCMSVRHVHLRLGKVAKDLNKAFSVQMGLQTAAMFVMFIGLLYELYILATRPLAIGRYLRACVIATWLVVYFLKLLVISNVCEKVCVEAQRTGVIVSCIDENTGDPEMPDELKQFSLQLFHDPLVFNPCQSIVLGHQFIRKFMATVTTYLVIIIQMTPATSANRG